LPKLTIPQHKKLERSSKVTKGRLVTQVLQTLFVKQDLNLKAQLLNQEPFRPLIWTNRQRKGTFIKPYLSQSKKPGTG
jgi:hypothetical protein